MAEQLIRNEQVAGSIPVTSSIADFVYTRSVFIFLSNLQHTHLLRQQKANIIFSPQACRASPCSIPVTSSTADFVYTRSVFIFLWLCTILQLIRYRKKLCHCEQSEAIHDIKLYFSVDCRGRRLPRNDVKTILAEIM